MAKNQCQARKQLDDLLSLPQQAWLLGAGISRDAGIPLMAPLTGRVESSLAAEQQEDFKILRAALTEHSHVEHILSHLADLISVASRTREGTVLIGERSRNVEYLRLMHAEIQKAIRDTVRYGFIPATDPKADNAKVGTRDAPVVTIDAHERFGRALFRVRRANLERRPPVAIFTTNYDTLLEDALALCRVRADDGFSGGAMAFWELGRAASDFARPFSSATELQAKVYKLHGSIDWFRSGEDVLVRRRDGAGYPPDDPSRLLIYPQATKYQLTQKDPFSSLFAAFRAALNAETEGLLAVCGYSFGDEHVNEEIATALRRRDNRLTVVAFVKQPEDTALAVDEGLPSALAKWLQAGDIARERILVAGSRGFYHGSMENRCPAAADQPHAWWSFEGVTRLLESGTEVSR